MSIQLNVNVQTVSGSAVTTVGAAPRATQDDFIKGSVSSDVIDAGDGNDRIWAGGGADLVFGGNGDDVVYGEGGNDDLYGDAGNDWLYGGADEDRIFGGIGNDVLSGGTGTDFIYGGDGRDLMWGDQGDDQLFGDAGRDMLNGGSGDDRLTGGSDADSFQYWMDNSKKAVNFGNLFGNDTITDFKSGEDKIDMVTVFERMTDADVNEVLLAANDLFDPVTGMYNEANRRVTVGGQRVWIGDGYNEVQVGQFTSISGDTIQFELMAATTRTGSSSTIRVTNLSDPTDMGMSITFDDLKTLKSSDFSREGMKVSHGTNTADVIDYSASGISADKGMRVFGFDGNDTVTGTSRTDYLYAGNGNDTLNGGGGDDTLWGEAGNDTLNGGAGTDRIWGGAGNDIINGDAGNDFLIGNLGDDILTGGAGNDTFILNGTVAANWTTGRAVLNLDTGAKTITDFTTGQDMIRFADMIPHWNLASAQLRNSFVSDWFEQVASKVGTDLILKGDNNGAAAGGEWSVTVKNGAAIYDDLHISATNTTFNWQDYFNFG